MKEAADHLSVCARRAALFAVMFLKREGALGSNEVPGPISSERRGGGYLRCDDWLEGEHIRTSLRERFNSLATRP